MQTRNICFIPIHQTTELLLLLLLLVIFYSLIAGTVYLILAAEKVTPLLTLVRTINGSAKALLLGINPFVLDYKAVPRCDDPSPIFIDYLASSSSSGSSQLPLGASIIPLTQGPAKKYTSNIDFTLSFTPLLHAPPHLDFRNWKPINKNVSYYLPACNRTQHYIIR